MTSHYNLARLKIKAPLSVLAAVFGSKVIVFLCCLPGTSVLLQFYVFLGYPFSDSLTKEGRFILVNVHCHFLFSNLSELNKVIKNQQNSPPFHLL